MEQSKICCLVKLRNPEKDDSLSLSHDSQWCSLGFYKTERAIEFRQFRSLKNPKAQVACWNKKEIKE